MKTKNYIYLKGGIVSIRTSRTLTVITLATDGGGGGTSFPNIVFYNSKATSKFKVGDRVTTECHAQLRRVMDSEGKVLSYNQDYVGDSISLTPRILAEYLDDDSMKLDGGCQNDENYALIFGYVRHLYTPNDSVAILSISVPRKPGNRFDNCDVACFKRQAEFARLLKEDDAVAIAGIVRTRINNKDHKSQATLQNIVCKDIAKVDGFENIDEGAGA